VGGQAGAHEQAGGRVNAGALVEHTSRVPRTHANDPCHPRICLDKPRRGAGHTVLRPRRADACRVREPLCDPRLVPLACTSPHTNHHPPLTTTHLQAPPCAHGQAAAGLEVHRVEGHHLRSGRP